MDKVLPAEPRLVKFPVFYGTRWFIQKIVHKNLAPVNIVSQMSPVHTLPPYFLHTRFNIIFPFTVRIGLRVVSSLQILKRFLYALPISPMRATSSHNLSPLT
jgi:hypothetical protein